MPSYDHVVMELPHTVELPRTVAVFDPLPSPRDTACKLLEEAAEVFSALENLQIAMETPEEEIDVPYLTCLLEEELADVVQCVANLAAACGVWSMMVAMDDCRLKNARRGRFDG